MVTKPKRHISVMLSESIEYLKIRPHSIIVDCTLGLGGHTHGILSHEPHAHVIGIDQDQSNLKVAKERLKEFGGHVSFYHSNFEHIGEVIEKELADSDQKLVDGILFDLGICSTHIDEADRGFSFRQDGPLDMRFDRTKDFTAEDIIKTYSATELQDIFSRYGEEREAKTVAEYIVKKRKEVDINSTLTLNSIIENAKRFSRPGRAAGTNVFQALRIEVNQEFKVLEKALLDGIKHLKKGGRMVVIAYHSLEDRIVKKVFKEYEDKGKKDDEFKLVKFIVKKPQGPSKEEVEDNVRSRSALMRVIERV